MRKSVLSVFIVISSFFLGIPAANAQTINIPCGGAATYSVLMPQGVLLDGKNCGGDLVIDSSVKIIDQTAFNNAKITSAVIPNSVTSIGDYAFAGSQITSVSIPNSVISIGVGAFQRTLLTSVNIPDSLSSISSGLFSSTKLTSVIIPNSVKSIEGSAFASTPLTSVAIPNSINRIGNSAFANTQLTSVTIPISVTSLGSEAFSGNISLVSISIPDELSYLGEKVFDRNFSLSSILYCGKLTGFPIAPSCPLDRRKKIDAKYAAANAESDLRITAAKLKYSKINAEIESLIKKYPSKKSEIELYKRKIALFESIELGNVATVELNLAGIESKLVAMRSIYSKIARTITCTKGKKSIKVLDVTPKCPAGYKKK